MYNWGGQKIIITACHSGKLKLAFTSPNITSTSPKSFLTSIIYSTILCQFEFLKKHHLPIGQVNPFNAKCEQGQKSEKILKFGSPKFWKQIAPFESTRREFSFEWSHHRILSTDSKVITTLRDSNIHSCWVKGLRTEFTSLKAKSTSPWLLDTTFFAHW